MKKNDPIAGSAFVAYPLERHVFVGNGWTCSHCHRPRAMHLHDGFVPGNPPVMVSMAGDVRYGRHPRFTTPKSIILSCEEQATVDAACSRSKKG